MARNKPSATEIRAELAKLQGQLKEAQRAEEETAGKLARKSGLLDLGLSDNGLMEAFKEVVARFQRSKPTGSPEGASQSS